MTGLAMIAAVIMTVFVYAAYQTARERVNRVGLARIVVRFLLGRPWHGEPLTDAGFRRPGTKALTRTGHASRFHHRPGWQRIAMRLGPALFLVLAGYGWVTDHEVTVWLLRGSLVAGAAGGVLYAERRWTARQHRKSVLYPLHVTLAQHLEKALPSRPESWLKVARDKSRVEITLPANFDANSQRMERIVTAASARLGIEAPRPKWELTGAKPMLILTAAVPPPGQVAFLDVADAIARARADELVLGIGREGRTVTVSLSGDSPHLGLSIGSGGGKSVTAELLAAQAAYRGSVVLVLDFPKLVSLPALRHLPNVAYCDSAALVHAGCVWLAHELEDRAALVRKHTDHDGIYRGPRLNRLLVICEESNALMNRLKRYWSDTRQKGDPKASPAIDGLELALLMGRQLYINLVMIGQYLTAAATGSGRDGAGRENLGVRILGRATTNNWKNLVPEHPYPGKTKRPGRVHVVTDDCRETQIVNISHAEARHLAVSGLVTACPERMPGRQHVSMQPMPPVSGPPNGGDQQVVSIGGPPVLMPPVLDGVSLSEAAGLGMLPGTLHAARKRAQRDPDHPQPIARRGRALLYDPQELTEYVEGISNV